MTLITQGAEAKLYIGEFNGEKCLIKERFVKKYRLPELDSQLTKERIRAEIKAVARCKVAGILTPKIFKDDLNERKIYMEYFDKAITVKEYINDVLEENKDLENLGKMIGTVIGKMHANNIIHGDLTSSNMLLNPKSESKHDNDLVMIDFGLAHYQTSPEDKGVDLYVLERALLSAHSGVPELFPIILNAYKENNSKGCNEVISKLEEVRARGRKRTMVG